MECPFSGEEDRQSEPDLCTAEAEDRVHQDEAGLSGEGVRNGSQECCRAREEHQGDRGEDQVSPTIRFRAYMERPSFRLEMASFRLETVSFRLETVSFHLPTASFQNSLYQFKLRLTHFLRKPARSKGFKRSSPYLYVKKRVQMKYIGF